jgi:hypothetical protein
MGSHSLRVVAPLRSGTPVFDTVTSLAATHAPRPGNDAPFR